VNATKSEATFDSYSRDLEWFQKHIKRHYVSQVTRQDIRRLMGVGRDEELNQKTINKRLIVGLMAVRNAGVVLKLKKGDWPKTIDKSLSIYGPEEIPAQMEAHIRY
jgi:site-specific recombinase XerC